MSDGQMNDGQTRMLVEILRQISSIAKSLSSSGEDFQDRPWLVQGDESLPDQTVESSDPPDGPPRPSSNQNMGLQVRFLVDPYTNAPLVWIRRPVGDSYVEELKEFGRG